MDSFYSRSQIQKTSFSQLYPDNTIFPKGCILLNWSKVTVLLNWLYRLWWFWDHCSLRCHCISLGKSHPFICSTDRFRRARHFASRDGLCTIWARNWWYYSTHRKCFRMDCENWINLNFKGKKALENWKNKRSEYGVILNEKGLQEPIAKFFMNGKLIGKVTSGNYFPISWKINAIILVDTPLQIDWRSGNRS